MIDEDEDDDDEFCVNMEINAFDDKALVAKTKMDTFAFVEKINYDPDKDQNSNTMRDLLGTSVVNNTEVKYSNYLENYSQNLF
jgi:hypothetical protein